MRQPKDNRRLRLLCLLCAAAFALGTIAAVAVAGNANASSGSGVTTGHHGQDCQPGYHDANGVCEHNGNGGGNCGDNQSGNNNGMGNGGNDNGFGHKGDCEQTSTSTTTPTTSTRSTTTVTTTTTSTTNPHDPTTTSSTTTTTTTTPSTTTAPFTPPVDTCARKLVAAGMHMHVGRRSLLAVTALHSTGQAVAGIAVLVRGAGLNAGKRTNAAGIARFSLRPTSAGVVRIRLLQVASCGSVSQLGHVLGAFAPPKPNFTG